MTVVPGERVILFVAIDVSSGTTLYSTIGIGVSSITSTADRADLVNSQPTRDVIITKTGGRGLSDIVINEVARKGGHVDWVEIFNKKGSAVSGWKIKLEWTEAGDPPMLDSWTSSTFNLNDGSYIAIDVGTGSLGNYPPWDTATALKLIDDTGSTHATYSRYPSISNGYSDARYIDSDGKPTSTWYTEDSPNKAGSNDLIPEFSDIAYPLFGLVAIFIIVRNVNGRKKRKKDAWP